MIAKLFLYANDNFLGGGVGIWYCPSWTRWRHTGTVVVKTLRGFLPGYYLRIWYENMHTKLHLPTVTQIARCISPHVGAGGAADSKEDGKDQHELRRSKHGQTVRDLTTLQVEIGRTLAPFDGTQVLVQAVVGTKAHARSTGTTSESVRHLLPLLQPDVPISAIVFNFALKRITRTQPPVGFADTAV